MAYRRFVLSLAAVVAEPRQIVSRDTFITEVLIPKLAGEVSLHFGQTAESIGLDSPISFQPTGEEAENGLFWTNTTAQAGVSVVVIVATGKRPTLNPELLQRI